MDWNAYHKDLITNLGTLGTLSPEAMKGYETLSGAADTLSVLDKKTQELIALAVAVTTRCDGCISVHSRAALKAGASKEEIAAALSVAIALNAGAALVYSSRVIGAISQQV